MSPNTPPVTASFEIPRALTDAAAADPGLSLSTEPSPEVAENTYVMDPPFHDWLAQKFNVSIEEAELIARWEHALGFSDVETIVTRHKDAIVDMRISPAERRLTIYASGDDAEIAEDLSGVAFEGVFEVEGGYTPLAELREAWATIEAALDAEGLAQGAGLTADHISITSTDPDAARNIVAGLDIPAKISIGYERGNGFTRQVDLEGGHMDNQVYGVSQRCTLGFAATRSDGTAGMVSAGHCPESSGTRVVQAAPTWISSSSCLKLQRTLQYYNDASNPELDAQFLRDASGTPGSCVDEFHDDVCSFGYEDVPHDFFYCISFMDVTGWSWTNKLDSDVAMFGGRSGSNYGTILFNLYDPCGPCSADYVRVLWDHHTEGGDSGGPVRQNSTLQGIHMGVDIGDPLPRGIYTKVGFINAYGMHPATSGPVGPNT